MALAGVGLACWQYKIQEKRDEAGDAKLTRIDEGVSNIQVFVKRDFSNRPSPWTVAGLPIDIPQIHSDVVTEAVSRVITLDYETNIVSKLKSAKPLETVIWLTSSQSKAKEIAEQIESIFKSGGFTTAHIVREIPQGQYMFPAQIATTNGVQILSKELTEPALTDALVRLMYSVGSKSELWAGQSATAPLVIAVRDQ